MLKDSNFKDRILRLLREDIEFRHAISGLIGLEEIIRRIDKYGEAIIKLREEMVKGFENNDNNFKQFKEEVSKGLKKYDIEFERIRKDFLKNFEKYDKEFEHFERRLLNLDMRWDLIGEKTFKEKIREVLDKEIGLKFEKWVYYDKEGIVYGYPNRLEVDIVNYNNDIILMEFLPHVEALDVEAFKKKAMLYEKITGRKPSRLLIITPYADEKSLVTAKELEVEIYIKI